MAQEFCGDCGHELCGHGRCQRCDGECPHHEYPDGFPEEGLFRREL